MSDWMKSLLLLVSGIACAHAHPLQKTFSDWQITCNNVDFCVTRSLSGENGLVMTLSRHAGRDDRPQLRIDYGSDYSGELPGAPLQNNLLIDGRRLRPDFKHWTVAPHHLITRHPVAIEEFLGQIREANMLQLTWRSSAAASLHGLKAALLFMDDIQGRVNSTSAWIKRGSAERDTPAPVAPVISRAASPAPLTHEETSGLLDYGTWRISRNGCSIDPGRREVSVFPLTNRKALLLISCETGAYNVIWVAFEVTRNAPYASRSVTLTLPFVPPERSERTLELINAAFDATTGELFTFGKGRGLGDCGNASRWQFDGRQFVLAEYAEESTCDGWHGSDDWPTLWVSQP